MIRKKILLKLSCFAIPLVFIVISSCTKDNTEPVLTIDELKNLTTSPVLSYPANNEQGITSSFTFKWNASIWSDGKDHGTFTYIIYYINRWNYTNSTLGYSHYNILLPEGVTEYAVSGLDVNTLYDWRVEVYNQKNQLLKESNTFTFMTFLGLSPTAPTLTSPSNNATNISIKPRLKWNVSTDPEGKILKYDVYLDKNTNPQTKILVSQTTTDIEVPLGVDEGCQYFWKVVAKDPEGNQMTSEIRSFSVVGDKTWIPDANFRTYLKIKFPNAFQGDTLLYNHSDITNYNGGIDVRDKNISSLKGIEYFTGITILQCSFNNLYSLNVSKNTSLKELYYNQNHVSSINLKNNVALENLSCQYNSIASMDLSKNVTLKRLVIDFNDLTSLNLSNNVVLNTLWCFENMLTSLDISAQTSLSDLSIGVGTNAGWVSHSNLLTLLKVNDAVKNHQEFKDAKTRLPAITIEVYSSGVKTCSNYDPNANGGSGLCIIP